MAALESAIQGAWPNGCGWALDGRFTPGHDVGGDFATSTVILGGARGGARAPGIQREVCA